MTRLPQPGSDKGTWGGILNDYLQVAHADDGIIKPNSIDETQLTSTARAKLNSTGGLSDGSVTVAKLSPDLQTTIGTIGSGVTSVNTRSGAVVVTQSDVGLSNVDNTSDMNKPVSTAQQSALDGKAAVSHTHTASQLSDSTAVGRAVVTAIDATTARTAIGAGVSNVVIGTTAGTAKAGDYVPTKSDVGLANVDNTSDISKPISTLTQTAINLKADTTALTTHTTDITNPHAVTKAQVGLGNVVNVALLVLGPSDPVPGGTPVGTVIVRTT